MSAVAILAVTDAGRRGVTGVVFWSTVLVVLILVAFAGYTLLRRWMRTDGADSSAPARGFTLSELREMHRQGELSDAEYEATRAQMLGAAKRAADRMPPVLPRKPQRPAPPSTDDPDGDA